MRYWAYLESLGGLSLTIRGEDERTYFADPLPRELVTWLDRCNRADTRLGTAGWTRRGPWAGGGTINRPMMFAEVRPVSEEMGGSP